MKRLKILIIFQYLHRDSPIFFMILSSKSKIKNHSFFGVYLLRGERSEVLNLGEKCVKFDNESFKEFVMGAK